MNDACYRAGEALAGITNPIYPFDKLQSFAVENPLFCWFLLFAAALGVWLAVVLGMVYRKGRTMSLSLTASDQGRNSQE